MITLYEDRSNKRTGKIVTFILILIIGTGAFFLGTVYGSLNSEEIIDNGTPVVGDLSFDKLYEVRDVINSQYYQDIDQDALVEGAIKGMVNSVGDPYTVFFNAEEYKEFNDDGDGNYVGIGVIVGISVAVGTGIGDTQVDAYT